MAKKPSVQTISVIVPKNPFVPKDLQKVQLCLAALNVQKLMQWWPGTPHEPHRDAKKVKAIQRSLDWKRVCQIAAYLLQDEILDAPEKLDVYFQDIYEPRKNDPGREWPPKVPRVAKFQPSEFPTFPNVLLHINGAKVNPNHDGSATLVFDEFDKKLGFSVIDGQHRINGAFLAIMLRRETDPNAEWEIPAEVFLDLDAANSPPRRQAQIFIDVNSHQKKVDGSLVADLFPTARSHRSSLNDTERAQDLGRKLMLDVGPLVGMIQIPGIKYGVKDVVTLATLNASIERELKVMRNAGISSLSAQSLFLAQCLDAWLQATGRKEEVEGSDGLNPNNVAYQGRVVVSFLTLLPACIWKLQGERQELISDAALRVLKKWLTAVMQRAGLLDDKKRFISKTDFRDHGFLGSGGISRFRDVLWAAALSDDTVAECSTEELAELAQAHRSKVYSEMVADE